MNKLPENSDQTKTSKKSPSITRIATRGIINIFVPLSGDSPDNEFCTAYAGTTKTAGWTDFVR